MVAREETAVEVPMIRGWYRGSITLSAGGRPSACPNTTPETIAVARAVQPSGASPPLVAIDTEQVMAIRPYANEA